jgi:hygromycin-B 7''-O-kinase
MSNLALAEVRARQALQSAKLDSTVDLRPASSVTNEVWLSREHVVRVNRKTDRRLRREVQLAASLPPEVGYPEVVAHGNESGFDWVVTSRRPGHVLSRSWPSMDPDTRREAVRQLADVLRVLHRTELPADLPPLDDAPQLLVTDGSSSPTLPLHGAIERVARLPFIVPELVRDLSRFVDDLATNAGDLHATTLVHGDMTFENVLWDGERISSLFDFEWARAAPPDVDLDVLLRFCAQPELHVADDYVAITKAADYRSVPSWFRDAYPELFEFPGQLARLRLYAVAFDVRELLRIPPSGPPSELPESHPLKRLLRTLRRRSYLDDLAIDR